jgi:hypothetical protein
MGGLQTVGFVGFGFQAGYADAGWGQEFGGNCRRMLGCESGMNPNALLGGLLGGLFGGMLGGGGNPMGGLLGGLLGGLIAGSLGQHLNGCYANPRHPHHAHAACYPPSGGGFFGGSYGGAYNLPQGNCGGWGQPHWGNPGGLNVNFNFNFGHMCPPSECCRQPGPRQRDGQLCQEKEGKPIEYTTSGGYKIKVDKHDIFITDPSGKNTVKHHGDPHEDLNGKHIKDWAGKQRTIVLGDGTKITMKADGPHGVTLGTSIYDGRQNVQIENSSNKVSHHSFNLADTLTREKQQHDGETSTFTTDRSGAGIYNNIYTEDESFNVTKLYQKLARSGGSVDPKKVEDFFDDPRLGHT